MQTNNEEGSSDRHRVTHWDRAVVLTAAGLGMTVFAALAWPSSGSPGIWPFVSVGGLVLFCLGILTGLVAAWRHFFKKAA